VKRIDERLGELAASGELSGLPGEGQPFPREDTDLTGDRWAAFQLMRSNAILPRWVELRREIAAEETRLVRVARAHLAWRGRRAEAVTRLPAEHILSATRATAERERAFHEYVVSALPPLNSAIARHNALVPSSALHLRTRSPDDIAAAAARLDDS
jgi:hypothetical protein